MSTPTPRTDRAWNVHGDIAEAAWSLARKLERELAAEREKVKALREAAVNVAMIGRVWLTVWHDKFTTETVRQFERAEGVLLATLATEETK